MKLNYNDINFIINEAAAQLMEEGIGIDRFPQYGYCLIMAGGSGSGKSTLLSTDLDIQGKFFDVDSFRDDIEHLRKEKGNFNADSFKKWKSKESKAINDNNIDIFLKSQTNVLNNIIIDTTASDKKKTEELIKKIKSYGYKIGLLWVATNRSVALQRNIKRGSTPNKYGYKGRQVPDSGLHTAHNGALTNIPKYLTGPMSSYIDEAWITFTSGSSLKDNDIPKTIRLNKTDKGFIITPETQKLLDIILGKKEAYTGNKGKTQTYLSSPEIKKMMANGEEPNDYLRQIEEGIEWSNDNGTINLKINSKTDDESNGRKTVRGVNSWADTRLFDEPKKIKTRVGNYLTPKQATLKYYQSIIDYINGGKQNPEIIYKTNVPEDILRDTEYYYSSNVISDEQAIALCNKAIQSYTNKIMPSTNLYNRADQAIQNSEDKVAKYKLGIVPGTNIKFIGLFGMNEFNLSDAIKHGTIRQNDNTDTLLGISPKDRVTLPSRGRGAQPKRRLPVTYDDGITPDIENNFSLKDVPEYHQKQSFGFNDVNYTSPTQFLDKSVMYAAYALKQEGFYPDFIVTAPSSSPFNKLYCTNLSNKIGVEYLPDFFKRNVLNVKYGDENTREKMRKIGISEKAIFNFENEVREQVLAELTHVIQEPLKKFFTERYAHMFSNISLGHYSREKYSIEDVYDCFKYYYFDELMKVFENNQLEKYIFEKGLPKKETKKGDARLYETIYQKIMRTMKKPFVAAVEETKQLMTQYAEQLRNNGYKWSGKYEKFKITKIDAHLRQFLKNVYVIADEEYLNEFQQLYSRYANGKFLIFDEDIDSGATLKLVIEALSEKLPNASDKNIMCLVNGYKDQQSTQ